MQLRHEQSRALLYRAVDTASLDPTEDQLVTGWAAAATVMETRRRGRLDGDPRLRRSVDAEATSRSSGCTAMPGWAR